jgi:stage II sporulation protein E
MMAKLEANPSLTKNEAPREWNKSCIKVGTVLETMKQLYDLEKQSQHWKRQIVESRQLVADQLFGVSRVMEDLAKEIKREGQELYLQEEQIRQALEKLGLSIHSIDIISLDEGNVEIEIIHQYTQGFDECRKIIAPMLSDILGENIAVKSERLLQQGEGYSLVVFGSAKEYEVETGVAGTAKGGDLLSGDSFSTIELGNGKFAVAVSDGMGNGERARAESSAALSILQQLLKSGMNERLAIKSVNSVLLLRSQEEMFATVDVALIDLYSANTTFLKIGSTPSFIKRGKEVIPITASNLPIGILQDIDVDLVSVQLKPGDILIMMTDGVYDAPGNVVNKEMWLKRVIQEMDADDPQTFADELLERVVRYQEGEIADDMTIVVAKVTRYKPEWATFRWSGLDKLERPRVVS